MSMPISEHQSNWIWIHATGSFRRIFMKLIYLHYTTQTRLSNQFYVDKQHLGLVHLNKYNSSFNSDSPNYFLDLVCGYWLFSFTVCKPTMMTGNNCFTASFFESVVNQFVDNRYQRYHDEDTDLISGQTIRIKLSMTLWPQIIDTNVRVSCDVLEYN